MIPGFAGIGFAISAFVCGNDAAQLVFAVTEIIPPFNPAFADYYLNLNFPTNLREDSMCKKWRLVQD
jgi:hypothetical protein